MALVEMQDIAKQWPHGVKQCEWCSSYSKGPCGCPANVEIDRLRAAAAQCDELRHAVRKLAEANAWHHFGECRAWSSGPIISPAEADKLARRVLLVD